MPAPTKSGYAAVNGVEIYYETFGSGRPLVLLHGGFMAGETFYPLVPAFTAAGHEVILVDLQGHGHTKPFDRPMTWTNLANDVAALIAHLGHDRADLLGYSLGALTALRTVLDYPEIVDRLIVVSAPYAFAGWHDYNQQGMRSMSGAVAESMKPSPLHELYARLAPDASLWEKTVDQTGKLVGGEFDWSADIAGLKAPTLLVFGDWDAVRTSHSARFFELLGGGLQDAQWDGSGMNRNRLVILQNTTHYNMNDNPLMAEAALRFLDVQ